MSSKKKVAKKAPKKPRSKKSSIPRQRSIPGMEDSKIAAIENTAFDYAELRDERVGLSAREVELKKKLIEAMHKAGKQEYKRNGISVKLTIEKEGVKVRVKESEDDLPTDVEPAPGPDVNVESMAANSEG